jgi:hypothetical protein
MTLLYQTYFSVGEGAGEGAKLFSWGDKAPLPLPFFGAMSSSSLNVSARRVIPPL